MKIGDRIVFPGSDNKRHYIIGDIRYIQTTKQFRIDDLIGKKRGWTQGKNVVLLSDYRNRKIDEILL